MKRLLTTLAVTAAMLVVALPAQADAGVENFPGCVPAGTFTWVDYSTSPDQLVVTDLATCANGVPAAVIGVHETRTNLPFYTPAPAPAPVQTFSAHKAKHHKRHHRHHHKH